MVLSKPVGVRLPEDVETKLREKASENGSKYSSYMRIVLTEHVRKESEKLSSEEIEEINKHRQMDFKKNYEKLKKLTYGE